MSETQPAYGPERSTTCLHCGARLKPWAIYLEVCGECLAAAEEAAQGIPSPGYGSA
jgi:hypothetical protein